MRWSRVCSELPHRRRRGRAVAVRRRHKQIATGAMLRAGVCALALLGAAGVAASGTVHVRTVRTAAKAPHPTRTMAPLNVDSSPLISQ